jgi:hypothetical protein
MASQQTLFTIANPLTAKHCDLLARYVGRRSRSLIEIRPELKRPMLWLLRSMNVHSGTLFSGLDGTCRRIGEEAAWGFR